MFGKDKASRDGVQAQALVLEKKVYVSENQSGRASACRYQLRVKFEDGSTTEISRRVFDHTLASAAVGDLIPVRCDPADRTKIEIDRHAIAAQLEATRREVKAQAIARGEQALDQPSPLEQPSPVTRCAGTSVDRGRDTGGLRIGDGDREMIANVLSEHMAEGRLSTDELDDRLGVLYRAQTRDQARSVLADLPPLAPSNVDPHRPHEQGAVRPTLPDWAGVRAPVVSSSPASGPAAGQAPRPGAGGAGGSPSDEEMSRAYQAWRAKVTKAKADKTAHKHAEATGDRKETFLAFRRLTISRAEEKSARAKFEQLRKRRPDWSAGAG